MNGSKYPEIEFVQAIEDLLACCTPAQIDVLCEKRRPDRPHQGTAAGHEKMRGGLAVLRKVAERLSCDGDEDLLGGAIRSHIAGTEHQIEQATAEREQLDRAAAYLGKCKYRRDIAKAGSYAGAATDIQRMFGMPAGARAWITIGES